MSFLGDLFGSRKYIAVEYDIPTQIKLRQWCIDNGFDLRTKFNGETQATEEFDFHTTVFYSSSKHFMKNKEITFLKPYEAKVTGIKNLGRDPLKPIPTLTVESDTLNYLRDDFSQLYNMKDEWTNYIGHVTISYNGIRSTPIHLINKLPDFNLYFNKLKIADVKEY